MNWSKAKNILIIALVMLNIFLFVTIKTTGSKVGNEKTLIDDTLSILESRGVEIAVPIPEIKGQAKLLHLGQAGLDKNKVLSFLLQIDSVEDQTQTQFERNDKKVVFLNRQFNHFYYVDQKEKTQKVLSIAHKKEVENFCMDFMTSLDIVWDEFTITDFSVNDEETVAEILITQIYQGEIVFDNYIRAIVSETGFAYAEVSCYQINGVEISDGKLLSPHQVLLMFFTKGSVGSKVTYIEQGFKRRTFSISDVTEEQVGLCWRVRTEDGYDVYVSLMNGQEVK